MCLNRYEKCRWEKKTVPLKGQEPQIIHIFEKNMAESLVRSTSFPVKGEGSYGILRMEFLESLIQNLKTLWKL